MRLVARQSSSFDYPGDAEEWLGGVGCVIKYVIGNMAGNLRIVPEVGLAFGGGRAGRGALSRAHLGHRLDVLHVDFLELADVGDYFVELGAIKFDFLRGQVEMGKFGYA
jgi:hypothetical protein